jgi:hypothetical protein
MTLGAGGSPAPQNREIWKPRVQITPLALFFSRKCQPFRRSEIGWHFFFFFA